jgi:hypothetical protein
MRRMTTERPFAQTRRTARWAGLLYTLVAVIAPIGLFYVPGRLVDAGDAALTAARIAARPDLLRLGMASELLHQALEVFLVLALVALFRPVDRPLTRQMAILGLIPIPMVFLNVLNELAALALVTGGPALAALAPAQREALALFFMHLHGLGLQLAQVFWGLWLFPLGLLAWRSGFIPRLFAVSACIGGLGYLVEAVGRLVAPALGSALGNGVVVLELGEPLMILWLLVGGARVPRHS